MFDRLGRVVWRARVLIVLAWAAATLAAVTLVPSLASLTSSQEASYLPAGSPARLAAERLAAAFPAEARATATVVFIRPTGSITEADRRGVAATEAWLRGPEVPPALADVLVSVEGAADVPDYAAMYRSADGAVELLAVHLDVDPASEAARDAISALRAHLAKSAVPGLETAVTGTAAITADYLDAVVAGTERTTIVTVALIVVILLLIYRAPVAATVPLLTIGAAFAVSRAVLALLAMAGWQIPSLLDTFIVVLIFGIGTDYAIFLLSRYREELGRLAHERAAVVTVGRIGAVITASAVTVMVGLGSMVVATFQMIQTIGPALAISVAITLAAGLTLTPALASLAGRWLYWPRHDAVLDGRAHAPGAWERVGSLVTRRPGTVAGAIVLVLSVPLLALPALTVEFDTLKELPKTVEARRGFDAVAAHFDRGQLLPVTVLLEASAGRDLGSPAGLAELVRVGDVVRSVPGVRSVRSLVTPSGDGSVPEGMRPAARLENMAQSFSGSAQSLAAVAALTDPDTLGGLGAAVAYLEALARAYPDVAAEDAFGRVQADVSALRDAVAAYQGAAEGSAERTAALQAATKVAPGLAPGLRVLAGVMSARPDDVFLPAELAAADPATARLLSTYLSADHGAARLTLVTADEPYSAGALATVGAVRALLEARYPGSTAVSEPGALAVARASVGGATATSADVQAATTSDFRLVGLITVMGVFVVLALLLRSLVAPLYLVGTVLLSFGTTMGLATLLFQGLLGQGGLNYLVPLIVFVLLVALGSDYNIFLMSRVREESTAGELRTGISVATARTGTVITSAGIILAGTFLALTVAPLQILQQIGLTVALGVLIDTFVVRSLLIPALTAFIGERAWWPSSPGRRASVPAPRPGPAG